MPNPDSEEALENAALALLGHLGWETVNCFDEVFGPTPSAPGRPNLGRENTGEVVLIPRLRAAPQRLNPALPSEAVSQAVEELTCDHRLMGLADQRRGRCI